MSKTIKLAIFTIILTLSANFAFAQTADKWLALGFESYQLKKYDQAIDSYTKCLEIDSKFADCYMGRGFAYNSSKKYQEAINDFSKFIEINPKHIDLYVAYQERAKAYFQLQDFKKAIPDFTAAIQSTPNSETYLLRGTAYFKLFNYISAIDDFTKAIELDPKGGVYYYARSVVFCTVENPVSAKADEQKAVQLGHKVNTPCAAKQNSDNSNQPVNTQPVRNSRQPTEAELKTSNEKGKTFAKNLDRLIQGKSKEEANKIIRAKVGELMKTDFYAGYTALILVKVDDYQKLENFKSFDTDTRIAMVKIQKFGSANWQFINNGKPKPLYPNDVPLPGTSWNSIAANNAKQNLQTDSKNLGFPKLPSGVFSSNNAEEFYQRGRTSAKNCEYQNAVAEFTKAIELDPKNGDYYLERAYAYIYIDKTLAEKDLRKAESLWAAEPKTQTSSGGFKTAAQLKDELKIRKRKDGQSAFDQYFRILRLNNQNALEPNCKKAINNSVNTKQTPGNSNPTEANKKAASEFYKQGLIDRKNCQYHDAVAAFTKAINLYENGHYYHDRAITYLYIDKLKAKADMAKAIEFWQAEIDSSKSEINKRADQNSLNANRSNFISSYAKLADKNALESDCKQSNNNSTKTNQNSGNSNKPTIDSFGLFDAESLGFPKLPSTKSNTSVKPEDLYVPKDLFERAKIYYEKGEYQNALTDVNRAIDFDSKLSLFGFANSNYYLLRGKIYQKTNEHQKAIDDFTKALSEFGSEEKEFYLLRSQSYCKIGDKAKALADEMEYKKQGGMIETPCK